MQPLVTRLAPSLLALVLLVAPTPATAQVFNEIRTDQSGTEDPDEYVEIAGAAGLDLSGLSIIVIGDDAGNSSGVIEEVIDLNGSSIDDNGYFVISKPSFSLGTADLSRDLNFEEDDNVTFLLVEGFSGANGDDLDTNDDGMLDTTPWTRIVDLIAMIEQENPPASTEYHYGPPTVGPDGEFSPAHVYRCSDGSAAGFYKLGDYDPSAAGLDTPGSANTSCPPPPDGGMPDAGTGPDAMPGADAGPGPDGGSGSDAGVGMDDAAPGSDAGGGGGQPGGGGCCSVAGGQATPGNFLLLFLVGGMLLYRRRRSC